MIRRDGLCEYSLLIFWCCEFVGWCIGSVESGGNCGLICRVCRWRDPTLNKPKVEHYEDAY